MRVIKIIGQAAIRLRAESKTLAVEIRRIVGTAIKQAAADLKPDTDGVTDGVRQDAERTSARVKNILGTIGSTLSFINTAFVQTALKAVTLSMAIGGIASSILGTMSLVGGLGQAIAGLGAAAAGVGAAGLTAMIALSATLKLATSGVSDAFKALASGDAAALKEALKGLAPEARAFVTETAKLKPIFDDIKLATQAALFKGLGAEVLATGKVLGPTFKGLFTGIAAQVNEAGTQVLKFLREARTVKDIGVISDNVTSGFREMSQAGRSITQVIVDIVKSASELLPGLGQSIETLTARFAAFIRLKSDSGELTQFFQNGIEVVKQFGRIIRDFGVGISNVFKIASDSGGGFLNVLERAATAFRNFTESIGGQVILTTLFGTLRDVSDAFGRFLSTLSPLLPLLGKLASVIGDAVITILDALGPVIEEVGRALIDALIETIPILVPVIIKLAEGFGKIVKALAPLLPVLAKVLEALTPIIDPFVRLAEKVLPPLIKIIEALTPVIELLATGLGLIVDVVASAIDGLANLGNTLDLLLDPLGTTEKFVNLLTKGTLDGSAKIQKGFRQVGHDAMKAIQNGLSDAQPEVFETVSDTINQMLVRLGLARPDFRSSGGLTWAEVGRGITTEQQAVVDRITQAAQALLNVLTGKRTDFATQGQSLSQALANGLTAGQQEAIDRVRAVIDQLIGVLTGRRSSFDTEGRAISERLGGGIQAAKGQPEAAARDAANAVLGIFSGTSLFSEGANIMNSLRSGLLSGVQAVKNVLTSMTSLIPTWKGPETLDRKLLVPAGRAIMGGLVGSIEAEIPTLRKTLATVTDEVATALDPLSSTALDLSPRLATGSAAGTGNGVGTIILQQTNTMLPGADINQFAAQVWRRGAADLAGGNSVLNVSQQAIQAGLAPPGSVVNLGV